MKDLITSKSRSWNKERQVVLKKIEILKCSKKACLLNATFIQDCFLVLSIGCPNIVNVYHFLNHWASSSLHKVGIHVGHFDLQHFIKGIALPSQGW